MRKRKELKSITDDSTTRNRCPFCFCDINRASSHFSVGDVTKYVIDVLVVELFFKNSDTAKKLFFGWRNYGAIIKIAHFDYVVGILGNPNSSTPSAVEALSPGSFVGAEGALTVSSR